MQYTSTAMCIWVIDCLMIYASNICRLRCEQSLQSSNHGIITVSALRLLSLDIRY